MDNKQRRRSATRMRCYVLPFVAACLLLPRMAAAQPTTRERQRSSAPLGPIYEGAVGLLSLYIIVLLKQPISQESAGRKIARATHFTHSAHTDERQHFERTEPRAGGDRHDTFFILAPIVAPRGPLQCVGDRMV